MHTRRFFLFSAVFSPWLVKASVAQAESEFERYKREQQQGVQALTSEWQVYQKNYLAAYQHYQEQLGKVWNKPELSSQKEWVEYSKNMQVRRVVDFEKNEVRISFTGQEAQNLNDGKVSKELQNVLQENLGQAYKADPILAYTTGSKAPASKINVSGSKGADSKAMLQQAQKTEQKGKSGQEVTFVIPLAAGAAHNRAQEYAPVVTTMANKWKVEPALVMAIMQTESAFNPMARSHIPAFGLMQIVPSSAGRDASKAVWGKDQLLTGQQLFNPQTNIELGCAYLNILDSRYLASITNPQSRLYCTICAYNTGAGNVARAFSGKTSVVGAAPRINAMTPKQVYAHLQRNLPYDETRQYLVRVTDRLEQYRA